jgi:hypothetical protein
MSEWIGICEYDYYEEKENIGYNNPPVAFYSWRKCFKGPPLGGAFCLKYEFREHPKDKIPPGWKFGPDKMPVKGSKWIIFIPNCVMPGYHTGFATYHGSYGRQEATDANIAKVESIIRGQSQPTNSSHQTSDSPHK